MEKSGLGQADMSPLGMFLAADLVVQAVIVGLLIASCVVWSVFAAKTLEVSAARSAIQGALASLRQASVLSAVNAATVPGAAGLFVSEAQAELRISEQAEDRAGTKERIASSLERLVAGENRRIARTLGIVATIGATAPFVGLFGTVWGIMNSFIGISEAHTTNLAVVAPGIAEALLATACGLIVAIPAVVIYNHFTRVIGAYRALAGDAAAMVHRLASRELDLPAVGRGARVAGQ